jgi:hypothetical protein
MRIRIGVVLAVLSLAACGDPGDDGPMEEWSPPRMGEARRTEVPFPWMVERLPTRARAERTRGRMRECPRNTRSGVWNGPRAGRVMG